MMKVLLVDDERLALEYLENIINWNYYGFELAGAATDSEQALSLYKKHKPELIISDIKMPGMNGLELVNAIRDYGGKPHILFLSAYKSFDYVKQAIRLNIDDYLLKSDLEEESFLRKILKLKEEIGKEKAKNQYTTGIIFEELFKKNMPEENYRLILDENDYIRIHKNYYYIILAQKVPPRFLDKYIPQSSRVIVPFEFEFSKACHKFNEEDEIQIAAIFAVNDNQQLAVLDMNRNMIAQRKIEDKLYYFSRKVFDEMNRDKEHQFNLYYYGKKMSLRQFGRFYYENRNQMSQDYLKKQVQIQEYRENRFMKKGIGEPKSVTSDEIYQMMKQENREEIARCLQTIRQAMKEEDYYSYLWYIKNMLEAISFFEGSLSGIRSGRRFSMTENSFSYDFRNPNQLVEFLEYKVDEIWRMRGESNHVAYLPFILKAIEYIQEKYGDPELSSAQVASHVNITASWLSTRFKEEVGIGVSDFINNVRIEKAKKMLGQREDMIYEVSEKAGFTSGQYFSKIFKEFVGVTPNQYRRNLINKENPT